MVMTKEGFLNFLTPERKRLMIDCVKGGLADYNNPAYYGIQARIDHTPSVVAAIRNCHIVARARLASAESPDMAVSCRRGRVLFTIADLVRVSFKKLNGRLRPRNIPTRQNRAFLGQRLDPQPPLTGLEDVPFMTNVVAGYVQDPADMRLHVHVICPLDESNYWDLELAGAEVDDFFATKAASPAIEAVASKVVKKSRARLRLVSQKDNEAEGGKTSSPKE